MAAVECRAHNESYTTRNYCFQHYVEYSTILNNTGALSAHSSLHIGTLISLFLIVYAILLAKTHGLTAGSKSKCM